MKIIRTNLLLAVLGLAVLAAPAWAQGFGSAPGSLAGSLAGSTAGNDPRTNLPPERWEELVQGMLNVQAAIGDDAIVVISSLPNPITLTCGSYTIVGQDVYKSVRGNPAAIPPFSVTYVKTKGFDTYCTDGIVGHTSLGRTITGKLDANSFRQSTVVLFSGVRHPQ